MNGDFEIMCENACVPYLIIHRQKFAGGMCGCHEPSLSE
jgi:hypothetical protein